MIIKNRFTDETVLEIDHPQQNWHGYMSDSLFSGILIRYSDDMDQYQIATYIS